MLQCGAKEALELKLTPRHIEIALLIAKGYSNRQIAPRLGLSEFTVRNHVADAMKRLNLPNRTALAVAVLTYGGKTNEASTTDR